jgi:two-component system LytT family response regulator
MERGKIRTIIIDDEPIARRNLRALLMEDPQIEIAGECGSGVEALDVIERVSPDLIFLDVQMPEMDGFALLRRIEPERMPVVVFVTAYDRYALRAFEAHALDYLLKPFTDERFEMALRRAKEEVERREAGELSRRLFAWLEAHGGRRTTEIQPRPAYATQFFIKSASRVFFVKVEEIDWIEAADYYARLHLGAKEHLLRETMAELENKLDPSMFMRIHRSTIVNLRRIKEVRSESNGEYFIVLHDGARLKLSRSRREQIETLLQRLI